MTVAKSEGEQMKRRLDALGLRDLSLKIRLNGNRLLLPLKPKVDEEKIRRGMKRRHLILLEKEFDVYSRYGQNSLATLLAGLDSSKTKLIPRSYDIIGDIAIIELPSKLYDDAPRIGEALLTLHGRLKSVYVKAGPVSGEFRLRQLRLIAGEQKVETVHRENGCLFAVNVATTFFNPRLGGERKRVALQVAGDEKVLDLFAGVGPFSVLIAKLSGAKVYAVDSNPEAIRCLRENLQLNHVEERVKVFECDAKQLPKKLSGKIDRIIMNLPEKSSEFVEVACRALKTTGGILHFYTFQTEPRVLSKAETLLTTGVEDFGRKIRMIQVSKAIREISPRTYQIAVDAEVM